MSCCVLGNSLRNATTFSRVCFRSRNRIAKKDGQFNEGHEEIWNLKTAAKGTNISATWRTNLLESLSLLRFRLSLWYSPRLLLIPYEVKRNWQWHRLGEERGDWLVDRLLIVVCLTVRDSGWSTVLWWIKMHHHDRRSEGAACLLSHRCYSTWRTKSWPTWKYVFDVMSLTKALHAHSKMPWTLLIFSFVCKVSLGSKWVHNFKAELLQSWSHELNSKSCHSQNQELNWRRQ